MYRQSTSLKLAHRNEIIYAHFQSMLRSSTVHAILCTLFVFLFTVSYWETSITAAIPYLVMKSASMLVRSLHYHHCLLGVVRLSPVTMVMLLLINTCNVLSQVKILITNQNWNLINHYGYLVASSNEYLA